MAGAVRRQLTHRSLRWKLPPVSSSSVIWRISIRLVEHAKARQELQRASPAASTNRRRAVCTGVIRLSYDCEYKSGGGGWQLGTAPRTGTSLPRRHDRRVVARRQSVWSTPRRARRLPLRVERPAARGRESARRGARVPQTAI